MNNLELLTIDSGQRMAELFSKIELYEIYLECFAQPPYEEYFTADEVAGLFRSCADKGLIVLCMDSELQRCAGFLAAIPLKNDEEIAQIAKDNGLDPEDYWFLEEGGVGKAYRHRQVFSSMEQEVRRKIPVKGILSRTKATNTASLKAHKKLGYRIVQGMTQTVTYKHLSGEIRQDDRVFMKYWPKA
ncbi:hypothetical protein [Selenomonas ruminantium]|uniref:N-acetyltransferase domain-containing protein n=1 Tax=Selenomonas ruminantium TaxID=971 RepID=A0A1H0P189_SELRU|nr:hypothetical protein [Selenomonas ruminantium]SDO98683.1 hypothetical protein SAMN05216366_10466 [Selenomonas ruminantium]